MSGFHAVIMAGGSGTRFWPASRALRPKQFLPLAHGIPLIRATVDRVADLVGPERVWIVTNADQARILPTVDSFPEEQVIVEPEPRDTAPCIALASARIAARDPDATLAFLPADHLIEPQEELHRMLRRGAELAADGRSLVTFGIVPTYAATGFGYVEVGARLDDQEPIANRVVRFREKPKQPKAEEFLAAGNFLWNSGIFVWTYQALLAAMRTTAPELAEATVAMAEAARAGRPTELTAAFRSSPKKSIDFAVMEKAPRVAVVRATFDWQDLGSFLALHTVAPTDDDGNLAMRVGEAEFLSVDAKNCVVYAEGNRTVALFGASDLLVVAVGDVTMVCPRERADDLKELVEEIAARGRQDLL